MPSTTWSALASFYGAADSARDLLDVVGVPGRLPLGKMSQCMRRLAQLAAAMAVLPNVGLAVLDDPYVSVAPDRAAECPPGAVAEGGERRLDPYCADPAGSLDADRLP